MVGQPAAEAVGADRGRAVDVTASGTVPAGIEDRLRLAAATGRENAVATVEDLLQKLLAHSPLGARVQQLVHLGHLLALGHAQPARLHARGALRAGARLGNLVGVAETTLVTAGMPAYRLGAMICAELLGPADGGSEHLAPGAPGRRGLAGRGSRTLDMASRRAGESDETMGFLLGRVHRRHRALWADRLAPLG